jgi:DNA polymerase III delta subunit
MYVVYFGDNRALVRDEATSYLATQIPAGQTAHTISIDNYEPGMVQDAAGATSLFGESEWYVIDEPSADEVFREEVESVLANLGESSNQFIIMEGKLLAPQKKLYAKYATDTKEFSLAKQEKPNPFQMAEALAQKDKRRLWVLLQEARLRGMREEEVIGILWWQLKALRVASKTSSAQEAGMKDFPYNKAKRALTTFKPGEIERLAGSLLGLYHDSHAGVSEIDLALERWCLSI